MKLLAQAATDVTATKCDEFLLLVPSGLFYYYVKPVSNEGRPLSISRSGQYRRATLNNKYYHNPSRSLQKSSQSKEICGGVVKQKEAAGDYISRSLLGFSMNSARLRRRAWAPSPIRSLFSAASISLCVRFSFMRIASFSPLSDLHHEGLFMLSVSTAGAKLGLPIERAQQIINYLLIY